MGIVVRKVFIVTTNYEPIYWEDLRGVSTMEEWFKENPMPENPVYDSLEEFLYDAETATGVITLDGFNDEFIDWLEELIWEYL